MSTKPTLPKTLRDIVARHEHPARIDLGMLEDGAKVTEISRIPAGALEVHPFRDTPGVNDSAMEATLTLKGVTAAEYHAVMWGKDSVVNQTIEAVKSLAMEGIRDELGEDTIAKHEIRVSARVTHQPPVVGKGVDDSDLPGELQVHVRIGGRDKVEQDAYYVQQAADAAYGVLQEARRQVEERRERKTEGFADREARKALAEPVSVNYYSVQKDDPWEGTFVFRALSEEITPAAARPGLEQEKFRARLENTLAAVLDDTPGVAVDIKAAVIRDEKTGRPVAEVTLSSTKPTLRHGAALALANEFSQDESIKQELRELPGNQQGSARNTEIMLAEKIGRIGLQLPLRVKDDFSVKKVDKTLEDVREIVATATGEHVDNVDLHLLRKVDSAGLNYTAIYIPLESMGADPAQTMHNIQGHLEKAGAGLDRMEKLAGEIRGKEHDSVRNENIRRAAQVPYDLPFSFSSMKMVNLDKRDPAHDQVEEVPAKPKGLGERGDNMRVVRLTFDDVTKESLDLETGSSSIFSNRGKVRKTLDRLGGVLKTPVGQPVAQKDGSLVFGGGKHLGDGQQQYGYFRAFWHEEKLTIDAGLYPDSLDKQFEALHRAVAKDKHRHQPIEVASASSAPQGVLKRIGVKAMDIGGNITDKMVEHASKSAAGIAVVAVGSAAMSEHTFEGALRKGATALGLIMLSNAVKGVFDGRGQKTQVMDAVGMNSPISEANLIQEGRPMPAAEQETKKKAHAKRELWDRVDIAVVGGIAPAALVAAGQAPGLATALTAVAAVVASGMARDRYNNAGQGVVTPSPYPDERSVKKALSQPSPGTPVQDWQKHDPRLKVPTRDIPEDEGFAGRTHGGPSPAAGR